jgi:hypothetical protein
MEIDIIEKLQEIQRVLSNYENEDDWEVLKSLLWMKTLVTHEEVEDEVFKPYGKTFILALLDDLINQYNKKVKAKNKKKSLK